MSNLFIHDTVQDKIVPLFSSAETVEKLKLEIQEALQLDDNQMQTIIITYANRVLKDHYECTRYSWGAFSRMPQTISVSY
jgi:hypothetical protein